MNILSIIIAAAIAAPAFARIGDTVKELNARYPEQLQPQSVNSSGRSEITFSVNDRIKVVVTLSKDGRSESEVFYPKNEGDSLTKEEINTILDNQRSPKVQWSNYHANQWAAPVDEDQRELIAHSDSAHTYFEVCTLEYQQRIADEVRRLEADSLQRQAELKATTEDALRTIQSGALISKPRKP